MRPKTLLTKHVATNVIIDVVSRDEARGLSYLTMISTTPPTGTDALYVSAGPVHFGEFRDRFVREGGEWQVLERRGSIQMKFFGAAAAG
jgi:SnoaL-like domain